MVEFSFPEYNPELDNAFEPEIPKSEDFDVAEAKKVLEEAGYDVVPKKGNIDTLLDEQFDNSSGMKNRTATGELLELYEIVDMSAFKYLTPNDRKNYLENKKIDVARKFVDEILKRGLIDFAHETNHNHNEILLKARLFLGDAGTYSHNGTYTSGQDPMDTYNDLITASRKSNTYQSVMNDFDKKKYASVNLYMNPELIKIKEPEKKKSWISTMIDWKIPHTSNGEQYVWAS